MRFRKNLYLGSGILNPKIICWKLRCGIGMADIYVISLAHGSNQLEYTHCGFFKQKAIRQHVGLIVGLAKGNEEAKRLILSMVNDSLQATGSPNVKEYLLQDQ